MAESGGSSGGAGGGGAFGSGPGPERPNRTVLGLWMASRGLGSRPWR
ncbi:KLHL26 isoform 5 [Pongo abelii]|uniref:KLHL26 isoform 5 n=1 Tax=Pongo abelii TaxID=9601 RepID=A0A2J8T5Q6_PONAB|nr:KLHL26 isoform 5 [Pongo abelii]